MFAAEVKVAPSLHVSTLDLATIHRERNTTLDSETMEALIYTQIRILGKKTVRARADFEKMSLILGIFDSMGFRDGLNNTIGALRPDWEVLRKVSSNPRIEVLAHSSVA